MPNEQDVPEDDIAGAVERARLDPGFMRLLAEHVQRDAEILGRLAEAEHAECVSDAAARVRAAHDDALRRLGDS